MIPKIIHYCWFGDNPLPQEAILCIESWKKHFPSYEIKEWNESNFDVNIIPYTAEAYAVKKYAFVSDYVRIWALYKYGGLYFDTDVEVIKDMSKIIECGPFLGCEILTPGDREPWTSINPGLGMGAVPKMKFYKAILDVYQKKHFLAWDGYYTGTIVQILAKFIEQKYGTPNLYEICRIGDVTIYPWQYFCPFNYYTKEISITENTYSIHHYAATWTKSMNRWQTYFFRLANILIRMKIYSKKHAYHFNNY